MRLDANIRKTGLIGHPVSHSKSPEMINAAYQKQGLPYIYLAYDVAPEDLKQAVEGMRALGFRGWNVTVPHKVTVMDHLDEVEESARLIGAVNTVMVEEGRLIGINTDGAGYLRSLVTETGIDPAEQQVVLIGAGGAARAVGYALARAGVQRITVVNRTETRAQELAARLKTWTETEGVGLDQAGEKLQGASLLVQTTSVGMYPDTEACPVDPTFLHEGLLVSDLIYHPRDTRLMREARTRGARVHGGLGMLLHQGALAYRRWTGQEAPTETMREILEEALKET
ncbi:shikimate dehydrogenase [Melghirimyces thermohalophilus]|uniref:Shikimate dehydrogenase (NADP(+)) n=1 Tax=Melghirimyces thermohalophilus TaxID=1236220 RepID=A0A1G6PMD7_9BACL|nr:shikimate dehydrogenase [Melghirimyces thermohalophilus]SDC80666.1 shikimate dehydrogenase [Melghirimyces thermohalophilus]